MSREADFTLRWWCDALRVGVATGFFPDLVLATWAIDTGWGKATCITEHNALLGIVCTGGLCDDIAPTCASWCAELGGSLPFYWYPSFQAFFVCYTRVLNLRQYDVVRQQATPEGQVEALANHTGFAGPPPNPEYFASLMAAMATIGSIGPFCVLPPTPPPIQTTVEAALPLLLGAGLLYASGVLLARARKGGL